MVQIIRDSVVNRLRVAGSGVTSLNGETGAVVLTSTGGTILITPVGTNINIESVGGGTGITWNEVTTTTQALSVSNGYVMNNASQVTGTLPPTAIFGSVIRIAGKGAGGWKVAQNSGQIIHFEGNNTTSGATGSLSSQNTFDCVDLLCITANTDWLVTASMGNIIGA